MKHLAQKFRWNRAAFFPLILLSFFLSSIACHAGQLEDGISAFRQRDHATAKKLLLPLAEEGNAEAQYNMGLLTGNFGIGLVKKEAVDWWRKAAEQGHAKAQLQLGEVHLFGHNLDTGAKVDYPEAIKWIRKAADQGSGHAQSKLAFIYEEGLGVQQDWQEVYFWSSLAAIAPEPVPNWSAFEKFIHFCRTRILNDERRLLSYEKAKLHLTTEQITATNIRIAEWKPVTMPAAIPPVPPQ